LKPAMAGFNPQTREHSGVQGTGAVWGQPRE
jgi:hypothetical protein